MRAEYPNQLDYSGDVKSLVLARLVSECDLGQGECEGSCAVCPYQKVQANFESTPDFLLLLPAPLRCPSGDGGEEMCMQDVAAKKLPVGLEPTTSRLLSEPSAN